MTWITVLMMWPSALGPAAPLVVPVAGALIWRFEGTRFRHIASWTVPLAVVLLIGEFLPWPLPSLVSLAGVAILVAMMFGQGQATAGSRSSRRVSIGALMDRTK